MNKLTICAITMSTLAAAGSAHAVVHQWDWQVGDPGSYGVNNNGGAFESITATYNDNSMVLTWDVTFSNQITDGFTLALNDGPNPKGHAGELALLYVDITDAVDPTMLAYAYNGKNAANSYIDGDGNTSGVQAPDDIVDADDRNGTGWIQNFIVEDTVDGKRRVAFEINAGVINTATPAYPGSSPWFGVGFGEKLGIWMHPFTDLNSSYDPATGLLTQWGGKQGYFDGSNFTTVPAPGPVALIAGAGVLAGSRRRKK